MGPDGAGAEARLGFVVSDVNGQNAQALLEELNERLIGILGHNGTAHVCMDDLCPPLCHELWNSIYPFVYALQNGASLDYGDCRAKMFDAACPDEGRVCIHGEVVDCQIPVVGARTE